MANFSSFSPILAVITWVLSIALHNILCGVLKTTENQVFKDFEAKYRAHCPNHNKNLQNGPIFRPEIVFGDFVRDNSAKYYRDLAKSIQRVKIRLETLYRSFHSIEQELKCPY